jgi:hypothetical protein
MSSLYIKLKGDLTYITLKNIILGDLLGSFVLILALKNSRLRFGTNFNNSIVFEISIRQCCVLVIGSYLEHIFALYGAEQ